MKLSLVVNSLFCLLFLLLIIGSRGALFSVSGRFAELDRGGVICNDNIAGFMNGRFSQNPRRSIPLWLCDTSLRAQKRNAIYGFILAITNIALCLIALRRLGHGAEKRPCNSFIER